MFKVLALLVLTPIALAESNVEAHLKPATKKEQIAQCVRDDKEVPRTSGGPRKVKFEETQEKGYFSKPELKTIYYINQDFDKHRNEKMQQALGATLRHTKLGDNTTIAIERFRAFTPDELKKKPEHTKKLKLLSSGSFKKEDGADLKVPAIYLTQASLLEKIAAEVTNTEEDFKKVYFVLEDDVSVGGRGVTDWADQVMCHISKLPADWDVYKFGTWGESLAKRGEHSCGHAFAYNDHSCQLKMLQGEEQWEWMGNMGFAVRPRGAANMLKYLRDKQVQDIDGAMLPVQWNSMKNAPNYYTSRDNFVWHKSPMNGRSGFIQREHTQTSSEKSNLLKAGVPRRLKKGQLEVWYVNLDESKQRAQCIEGQLKKQFIEPHRFSAVKYPTTCKAEDGQKANKNCFKRAFGDCMQGGINWEAVSSHGTAAAAAGSVQKGVIANWCSHKRIWDLFAKDNVTKDEKYYVVLEDDVILSPKFRLGLENFIATYTGDWKFIQVDTFGAEGRQIAFHNGKVTHPSQEKKFPGDNYGMHCLVVKQSALEDLRTYFGTHEVIPYDWIAKDIPGMITWAGNIAQNPEGHNGFEFQKPSFCGEGIYKSNIAGLKEDKPQRR